MLSSSTGMMMLHGPPATSAIAPVATSKLCPTCSSLDIAAILRYGCSWENRIPLGSLSDILRRASQCPFCHLVALLFRRSWCLDAFPDEDISGVNCSLSAPSAGALADPRLEESKRCHRLRVEWSDRPWKISDALSQANMNLTLEIQLLEQDANKFQRAVEVHGRHMGDTVDMHRVKGWVALCEREHGDTCGSMWWKGDEVQLPPLVRMVDVILMSVVRAPSDCRYVALSYVWGAAGDSYWTTVENMEARTQPAGLDLSTLPATIVDSIHVTQQLGERYLWIDALCIVQDSPSDKSEQIRIMELIYSGAILTIVAAGGESVHARLPGLSADSRPHHQHIEVVQGLHLAIPLPSLIEAITQTIWDTRGWTFQEKLLSCRRLFFTKHQVYFECAKDIWCEDLVAESKTLPYSRHPMRYLGSGGRLPFLATQPAYPELSLVTTYSLIVERYTRRQFTYPSDAIHAVSGITNALSRGYRRAGGTAAAGFHYGMHGGNLDHALLWQPSLDSAHTRRVSPDSGPTWPSWSWAGWIGAVRYTGPDHFVRTSLGSAGDVGKPLESLVHSWYIVDDYQQTSRLDVEKIAFIRMSNPGKDVVPQERYCPPIGDIDPQKLGPLPPVGTLIFRTQCASFKVSKLENMSSDSQPFPHTIFQILSDVRQPCVPVGRMILPSATPSTTIFQFIVLSRYGGMNGLYDENVYGASYRGCFLHVLAVKELGHSARVRERVGLGVIFEQAWLECAAQVETVFLG